MIRLENAAWMISQTKDANSLSSYPILFTKPTLIDSFILQNNFRLMFGSKKFERNREGKKMEKKNRRNKKVKVKEKKNIGLKSINYFNFLFQIYFIYLTLSYNLKIYKFFIIFIFIFFVFL